MLSIPLPRRNRNDRRPVAAISMASIILFAFPVSAGGQESTERESSRMLEELGDDIEVIEVLGEVTTAAESAQLSLRKMSAVVSDNISAEAIKISPDSDAGEIVKRIPAVTVKDGQYLNVRGLNERYTSALLNGSRLPSTDPERRVVPLDLFPSDFIQSLSLMKTYTPDLPGDFSGGLADIKLTDYPDRLTASIGISMGGDTETTFGRFATYDGAGIADWFGFGDEFRSIPDAIPDRNLRSAPGTPPAQSQFYARQFRNIWTLEHQTAPPSFGIDLSLGNSWGSYGAGLGLTYGTGHKRRNKEIRRRLVVESDLPEVNDNFLYDTSTFETQIGGLLSAGATIANNHTIGLRSLWNRTSEDIARFGRGISENDGLVEITELKYTVEELIFNQLTGAHFLHGLDVEWRVAYSRTRQDQPDGRFVTYTSLDDSIEEVPPPGSVPIEFQSDSCGGCRLFSDLEESLTDAAVDFIVPFATPSLPRMEWWSERNGKLKAGPAYAFRERGHDLRRFRLRDTGNANLQLPPSELLVPENLGPNGLLLDEETLPRDSFSATQEIIAGYGMIELPLYPGHRDEHAQLRHSLRLIGGARTEYSYITVSTFDEFAEPRQPILNDLDVLPGVNLVYSPVEDMNFRAAWSRAKARPEFRELSPVQYPSPSGLAATAGNEELISASIESWDLRWEWFLTETDLVSFSLFYKKLQDPIEQITQNQASNVIFSFANGDSATILGGEAELRANLGMLWRRLEPFDLTTNLTYVDSEVTIPEEAAEVLTNRQRELVGQAPYIINVTFSYTHWDWGKVRLLYNTLGERIVAAGANRLPDIIEQPRHQLDLVLTGEIEPFYEIVQWKLAFENLLNDRFVFEQGSTVWREYERGVGVNLSLSYSY